MNRKEEIDKTADDIAAMALTLIEKILRKQWRAGLAELVNSGDAIAAERAALRAEVERLTAELRAADSGQAILSKKLAAASAEVARLQSRGIALFRALNSYAQRNGLFTPDVSRPLMAFYDALDPRQGEAGREG